MGLVDRVKQNIADTVEMAREGVDQVNDFREKREVTQLYGDLGKRVFELVEKGELALPPAFDGELRDIRRTIADREYIKGTGSSRPASDTIAPDAPAAPAAVAAAAEAPAPAQAPAPGATAPTRDDI